jgi:hypothetical protein
VYFIGEFLMVDWFDLRKKNSSLHPKVKSLLDLQYEKERELLLGWIKYFVSPDGETKSIDQFQASFHSVFLELYLNELFRLSGAKIVTEQIAPDFKICKDEITYFIEATVSNVADEGRPEKERTESDVYGKNDHYSILNEAILRTLRRIRVKNRDFKRYSEEVKSSPFVLALGDFSQVNYGQASYYAPLAVLYNAYYDPDEKTDLKILCEDSLGREYKFIERLGKNDTAGFELGIFSTDKNDHISALAYTCMLSLGKLTSLSEDHGFVKKYVCVERELFRKIRYSGTSPDETLGDGLFIFHNPFAKFPLPDSFMDMKGVTHVRYNADENIIDLNCNGASPLIRRYTGPHMLAPLQVPEFDEFVFLPTRKI